MASLFSTFNFQSLLYNFLHCPLSVCCSRLSCSVRYSASCHIEIRALLSLSFCDSVSLVPVYPPQISDRLWSYARQSKEGQKKQTDDQSLHAAQLKSLIVLIRVNKANRATKTANFFPPLIFHFIWYTISYLDVKRFSTCVTKKCMWKTLATPHELRTVQRCSKWIPPVSPSVQMVASSEVPLWRETVSSTILTLRLSDALTSSLYSS